MGSRFGLLATTVALSVSSVAFAGNGKGSGNNGGGNNNGGGGGSSVAVDGTCQDLAVLNNYCVFSGNIDANDTGNASYLLTEAAYNPLAFADIDLNPILSTGSGVGGNGSFDLGSTTSGTWSVAGFNVDFIAIKGSNTFALYRTTGSSGTWSTSALVNGGGNTPGLSHLVFFGSAVAAVPEPATWGLLILGFGAVGSTLRRRNAAANFARARLTYA